MVATMAVVFRGLIVALVFLSALCVYAARRLQAGRLDARATERLRGEVLADTLQRLGATYVKFGQILGSRPDLLGPGYIAALARLQDAVAPAPFSDIQRVLQQDLSSEERAQLAHVEPTPIAAASVAQVHRATLADGREIALKVQRPIARKQIERDLSLMAFGAKLLDKIPSVHLLSLPGAVEKFGESLHGQLDFEKEAENNRRFARNFADWPDVRVPELVDTLCTKRVLAMEFVDGVKASQPEKVGGDRRRLARLGGETVLKMIFRDGFVHADLHPGNVLLTPDDKVVVIDLGMVASIPADMVRPWVETNLALAQQDGRKAARLFYGYAPSVTTRNYTQYEDEVHAFFETFRGKKLGEVEVSEVVGGIMNILRRHGVKIDPVFTVVNVSMLVAEGLGKQLDPDMDMIELSKPWLLEALAKAPPGRAPAREPPATLQAVASPA
jgi:ubiquinone biosynthesis protein